MRNSKFLTIVLPLVLVSSMMLSGCSFIDNIEVKMNLKNQQFDYIKQNKVDKIIIQSVRDSGFRFVVNDPKAIDDIYKILSDGSEVSKKSSLDPDYIFEVCTGDEVRKYQYVVGANEHGTGNFYDDDKAFSVPKNLENTIMQNLSFIRKPRDFNYIYYQSILKVIDKKKDSLSNGNKAGVNISGDTDCLKYIFSVDLEDFKKSLNKTLPSVDLVNNNYEDFDTIIKVKNRGYNSTVFKTLITVDNKKDNSFESYYVTAEYNYKDWDIKISEPNKVPQDW
ncbi:hypothetical protein AXY43_14495 [Clostridium sp. MF28]|uniref:Lipoprotein n=2 Tax=Clostridiaceae TaxID=31979 RepID=A0AAV3W8G2_9CLOT|nr:MULTISPECIES: hypothetical protein [Clostridium]AVK49118.1 hypothetical protein AXY43_14495 [Clostridium sp. MF28]PSM57530.1 hypothetical protein C4L39_11965 [Clostridium diolis]QES71363.1 hypothetical protein F3K33_00360 [Clostridium diolis]GEA33304.1 lipoprotein [Clostridium diolis]